MFILTEFSIFQVKNLFILVLLLNSTMMPNINPRQLQKAMQRMGVRQEEIEATEVIIKTKEKIS